jgi:hypothetical protein
MTTLPKHLKAIVLRFLLMLLTGLVLTGSSLPFAVADDQANWQKGWPSGPALAAAHEELTLFEFVGHVEQNGLDLVAYGYLTHVHGMDDTDLFAESSQQFDETTAKYTFVTTAKIEPRFVVGGNVPPSSPLFAVLFYVVSHGETTYYLRDPPVSGCVGVPVDPTCPADPAPFSAGTPIATMSGRYSDVNNVQSPGKGVISGTGEVTVQSVAWMHGAKNPLAFGRHGAQMRITYFGEAILTNLNPSSPQSFALVVGRATLIH